MNQYEIYFDMDGVLTDLDLHIYTLTGLFPNQFTSLDEMWALLQKHPKLFTELPPHHDMCNLVRMVYSSYKTTVLTAKPRRGGFPTIVYDKCNWIKSHVSSTIDVVVCEHAHEKTFVIRPQPNTRQILVDDLASNCARWENAGGIAIHHTSYQSTRNQLLTILNC